MPSPGGKLVCVTGAGGYIASWLAKLLLQKGYTVRGTVRNPDDPKNSHLRELEGAAERLILYCADLNDYESLLAAIDGCDGVFHTASPVTDDPEEVLDPAINGAKNAIRAAAEAKVRRIVLTSTDWYCYGKTIDERAAWDLARDLRVELVVLNPVLVLGLPLQATVNASVHHILKYLTGSAKTYANSIQAYVDVRDVAVAHLLLYETPAASGRYICAESVLHRGKVVEILAELFPEYPVPNKCSDEQNPRKKAYKFTNQKLIDLGLELTPVKQFLYETVKSLQEKGHLPKPKSE